MLHCNQTDRKKQPLVGAIPFCGQYPGPRFETKFRSANQMEFFGKIVRFQPKIPIIQIATKLTIFKITA